MDRRWDKSKPPQGPIALNRDCPQAQGLVCWYPMGGASGAGLVLDYGPVGNHLSRVGSPGMLLGPDGQPVVSLGTSNYFSNTSAPSSLPTTVPVSLSVWALANSGADYSFPFALYTPVASYAARFAIELRGPDSVAAAVQSWGTYVQANSASAPAVGSWHHVAGVFESSSSTTCYLNGVAGTTNTTYAGTNTVSRIEIGRMSDGAGGDYFHNGLVGEACVWNYAVSADILRRLVDPATKYELWYPLRSRKWFSAGAGGPTHTLTAEAASYALTGGAATLKVGRKLAAAGATYALSAGAAGLYVARKLSAAGAAYSLTGGTVTLKVGRKLAADGASYALTGGAATLTYSGSGAATHTLVADGATYALSGGTAALKVSRKLVAEGGVYAVTYQDAALRRLYTLTAAGTNYALSGGAATFKAGRRLVAEGAAYILAGGSAVLTYSGEAPTLREYLRLDSPITTQRLFDSPITTQRTFDSAIDLE